MGFYFEIRVLNFILLFTDHFAMQMNSSPCLVLEPESESKSAFFVSLAPKLCVNLNFFSLCPEAQAANSETG